MQTDRILPAIGLRLVSVVFLATMGALIKLAETRGAGLSEALFFRQAGAAVTVTAAIAVGPGLSSIRTARIRAHVGRAVVGLSSMACMFSAIMLLPLPESTALQFTVPIFATMLGALLLREPTGLHRWGAVFAGFAGVLIVAQPGSGHFPFWGAVLGLTSALLTALVSILLRQIGRTEATMTTVFWFSTLSVPVLAVPYAFGAQAHDPVTWAVLAGIGVAGGLGQICLTGALKLAPVSVVVPMDYSSLIWATLYGWLLFGVLPAESTWIGAPVIIGSGLYIVWREHLRRSVTATAQVEI
ncbi:MAG TPA: DMT family transporter [Sphingomonas sp.]|nr:DMT family transporter [Sphingomonas sp.]